MTETRMLRYNFTPEEHLANCDELARLFDTQSELEATHKSIKAQLKEAEEEITAKLGRGVRFVRDKYDHRPINCEWLIDNPTPGQKSLVRLDTHDTVEIRRMEDWEKQQSLNLQAEAENAVEIREIRRMEDWEDWAANTAAEGVATPEAPVSADPAAPVAATARKKAIRAGAAQ